jgi:hypothetical protein
LNSHFILPATLISKGMGIPKRSIYAILAGTSWGHVKI